jgi:O-methyltransferase involved in polyketide biosynthesis
MTVDTSSANAVGPTADGVMQLRLGLGLPFADKMCAALGIPDVSSTMVVNDFDRMLSLMGLKARWDFVLEHIGLAGATSVVDLAVGFSTYTLYLASQNAAFRSVEFDLAGKAAARQAALKNFAGLEFPGVRVFAGNALDGDDVSAKANAYLPSGAVAVVAEGLVPYLSQGERRLLLRTVRMILAARGGCAILTNCHTKKGLDLIQARGVLTIQNASQLTGKDIYGMSFDDDAAAIRFLEAGGLFRVQAVPLGYYAPTDWPYRERAGEAAELLQHVPGYVLTLA